MDKQSNQHVGDDTRDSVGQEADSRSKCAHLLDVLEVDIGNLIPGTEGSPDEEDVDANTGKGAPTPQGVGYQRRSMQALLASHPYDGARYQSYRDGQRDRNPWGTQVGRATSNSTLEESSAHETAGESLQDGTTYARTYNSMAREELAIIAPTQSTVVNINRNPEALRSSFGRPQADSKGRTKLRMAVMWKPQRHPIDPTITPPRV